MMKRYALALGLALALPGGSLFAQQNAPPAAPEAVDPARLALAEVVVLKLLPEGTYAKIMGGQLAPMFDAMMGAVEAMPVDQIAQLGGLAPDKAAELEGGTLGEITAIVDPHFRERNRRMMTGMMAKMGTIMSGFEPDIRASLARVFARKFSAAELNDLQSFFATPTGGRFASEYITLATDKEFMTDMMGFMPKLIEQLPDIIKTLEAETSDLPPRRTVDDLTPAQRKRLAELLGVDEDELRDFEPPADSNTL